MPLTKPAMQRCARKTAVLAVSGSQEDLNTLRCLFAGSSWELCTAGTLAEAGEWLQRNAAPVVLFESCLPDGDWKSLLRMTGGLAEPPQVVVMSRHPDNTLWVEALKLGAFDVLAGPASQKEVFRTLSSAWRSAKERRRRVPAAAPSAAACA